jgi:hypothetical protein
MGTVRAATLVGPRQLEIRSYPRPTELEPGAVLLRMIASGNHRTYCTNFRFGTLDGAQHPLPDHPGP